VILVFAGCSLKKPVGCLFKSLRFKFEVPVSRLYVSFIIESGWKVCHFQI
jgi:hypothetical protein